MRSRGLAAVALVLLAAGCSLLGGRTKNTIYSLDRAVPAAAVTGARGVPVSIDSIELPPGFDRREIVVRQANHQLEVRSNELWSATLQDLVLHTLAFDLAARLPEGMVILPGEAKPPAGSVRSIDVVFEEIAAGPQNVVTIDMHWIEHGRTNVTHREQITVDAASLDSANIAKAMSEALGQLADRMAAGL